MLKNLFVLAAFAVVSAAAQADDGGIAVINVLGVSPGTNPKAQVQIYGGSTKALYNVLPQTSVQEVHIRNIAFASSAYVVSVVCFQEYQRPTTGETREDYMCEFNVNDRKSADIDGDDTPILKFDDYVFFTPYALKTADLSVLGVNPIGLNAGQGFAWYGAEAEMFATMIPSTLTFTSGTHRVVLNCSKNYVRPTTGEQRSDYMCQLGLAK
jgi:hypothetical protein